MLLGSEHGIRRTIDLDSADFWSCLCACLVEIQPGGLAFNLSIAHGCAKLDGSIARQWLLVVRARPAPLQSLLSRHINSSSNTNDAPGQGTGDNMTIFGGSPALCRMNNKDELFSRK